MTDEKQLKIKVYEIDRKVDRVIDLLEGSFGNDGLTKRIEKVEVKVSELRSQMYKTIGILSVCTPILIYLLRLL